MTPDILRNHPSVCIIFLLPVILEIAERDKQLFFIVVILGYSQIKVFLNGIFLSHSHNVCCVRKVHVSFLADLLTFLVMWILK